MLQGAIWFEQPTGTAGVLLGMDDADGSGYFLRFNVPEQRLEFGKIGGSSAWYVDRMPELDRPLALRADEALHVRIIVDKTAMVAYVNDWVALSGRMYATPLGRCGLFVDGSTLSTTGLELRTLAP